MTNNRQPAGSLLLDKGARRVKITKYTIYTVTSQFPRGVSVSFNRPLTVHQSIVLDVSQTFSSRGAR